MVTHTIKLWQAEIAAKETEYSHYWSMLDQTEQQYASAFKNDQLHKRYVEIRARLRVLLGAAVNFPPEKLRIDIAEYGKPYLLDYPDLAFNISHTENKMIVAIAYNCLLGVDIESCKDRANLSALVEKCFAEEEKNYWQQLPKAQQTRAFYQFWTRKEAFVKATGRGLALGLRQCVINPEDPIKFLRIPLAYGQASEWFIRDIDLGESICGALAVKNKDVNHIGEMSISLILNGN